MKTFTITLKRIASATIEVQASSKAEARRLITDADGYVDIDHWHEGANRSLEFDEIKIAKIEET